MQCNSEISADLRGESNSVFLPRLSHEGHGHFLLLLLPRPLLDHSLWGTRALDNLAAHERGPRGKEPSTAVQANHTGGTSSGPSRAFR